LGDDDVPSVEGVDQSDERHQGGELVLVVVLGGMGPGLVGDAAGGVGEAGALLRQLQSGSLGVGEHRGLTPGRDEVEARRGLAGVSGVLGVHVGAEAAAVDLAGPDLHQLLRRGRQRRVGDDLSGRDDVPRELAGERDSEQIQASSHDDLLRRSWCPYDETARPLVTEVNGTAKRTLSDITARPGRPGLGDARGEAMPRHGGAVGGDQRDGIRRGTDPHSG
jgi:hypothetical protein